MKFAIVVASKIDREIQIAADHEEDPSQPRRIAEHPTAKGGRQMENPNDKRELEQDIVVEIFERFILGPPSLR